MLALCSAGCEPEPGTATPSKSDGAPVDDDDTGTPCDTIISYADADGDGYGNPRNGLGACDVPDGWVTNGSDCDDGDPAVFPGATELCNGRDDDCDDEVDSPVPADAPSWYVDADGDGYGAGGASQACSEPEGASALDGDCDDTSRRVNPGAAEVCNNGMDDDCDGTPSGCGVRGDVPFADADAVVSGLVDYASFGQGIDVGGDVTGDGTADILATSDAWVYVFSGTVAGSLTTGSASAAWTGADDGPVAAHLGDADGDGVLDVIVGSPRDATAGEDQGGAFLLLGPLASNGAYGASGSVPGWTGGAGTRYAGYDVAAAGDVDGDGLADALVAAVEADGGDVMVDESVYVLSGGAGAYAPGAPATARLFLDWDDNRCCEVSPQYLAGLGDIDGDGLGDVAVGTRTDAALDARGTAYVQLAPLVGEMDLRDADLVLDGAEDGDRLGRSVGPAGDIDGDGLPDLLAGDYLAASGGGAAYLVPGTTRGEVAVDTVAFAIVGTGSDNVGIAVAGAGDVDGDGYADVAASTSEPSRPGVVLAYGPFAGDVTIDEAGARLVDGGSTVFDLAGGDLDGDGLSDLVVGGQGDAAGGTGRGAVYVFWGGGM